MKKFVLSVLLVSLLVAPAMGWDANKQKNLGQDRVKMTWYILDYGKDSAGTPFAIARKYYTSESIKNETIDLLMSKYGISPEVAGSLYFTEYGYEYTPDGKQFAVSYLRHYDMLGNEIHGVTYDNSGEGRMKTFANIDASHASGKGAAYALGKTPTTAKKTTTATKTPAKRVVRKTTTKK